MSSHIWFIIIVAVFSAALWQFVDSNASPKTAEKLHRMAGIVFKWLVYIFVIGGVIGLLNLGWEHLTK
jgi:hypothetical protein